MKLSDSTAKQLVITIIYASVLGNYVAGPFAVAVDSLVSWEWKGFLDASPLDVFLKTLLLVGTILFFCFEYLYGLQNPRYKLYYLLADFANILLAGVIFESIHYKNNLPPDMKKILVAYMIMMIIHVIWSIAHIVFWKYSSDSEKQKNINHYSWVTVLAAALLSLFYLIYSQQDNLPSATVNLISVFVAILLAVICYFETLRRRKFPN